MKIGGDWKAAYRAAVEGDLEQLDYWLRQEIYLDYQHPEFGTTILIAAAAAGQRQACERLIAAGATADTVSDWDACTAEAAAREANHKTLADWLGSLSVARKT